MKLFKKLFLQIFLAFLVLSQAVFFYLLYESRRQAVESIQHYEKLSFQGKTGELDQKLRGMYETEEQEIQAEPDVPVRSQTMLTNSVRYLSDCIKSVSVSVISSIGSSMR